MRKLPVIVLAVAGALGAGCSVSCLAAANTGPAAVSAPAAAPVQPSERKMRRLQRSGQESGARSRKQQASGQSDGASSPSQRGMRQKLKEARRIQEEARRNQSPTPVPESSTPPEAP